MTETIETRADVRRQQHLDTAAMSARETFIEMQRGLRLLPRTEENKPAAQMLNRAATAVRLIGEELDAAGAVVPAIEERKRAAESASMFDLSALATLADPETERLLGKIGEALEIAERIDARRGLTVGDHVSLLPGESRGTDLAETISTIALRLRLDVYGPAGKD